MKIVPGIEAEFAGTYYERTIPQLKNAGLPETLRMLHIETGERSFFGLFPKRETWIPEMPPGFSLPGAKTQPDDAPLFLLPIEISIRFRGIPTQFRRLLNAIHLGMHHIFTITPILQPPSVSHESTKP